MKQHAGLHCLLFSLIDYNSNNRIWDSIIKHCQDTEEADDLPNPPILFYDFQSKNYIFVIIDGYVKKIKFNELKWDMNFSSEELRAEEITESQKAYFGDDDNEYPFIQYRKNEINKSKLFQRVKKKYKLEKIKWKICIKDRFIGLLIYKRSDANKWIL